MKDRAPGLSITIEVDYDFGYKGTICDQSLSRQMVELICEMR